ncbi:F-box protein [Senna tora]|uniref:F-box protein n=1 Tax=Senna tora TaxID=362788 RepID=A0A834XJA5_9FABA|nr:F-box protein [Senna tora]
MISMISVAGNNNSDDNKWSHIPDDILESIINQRLSISDTLRISGVCSNWRSTVAKSIVANNHCTPLPEFPLIFLQQFINISQRSFFFNLCTRRLSSLTITPRQDGLNLKTCLGSIQGWMILLIIYSVDAGRSVAFFNPVTNSSVYLPVRLNHQTRVAKIVASSKPTDQDCIVVCMLRDHCNLLFSRVYNNSDESSSWTRIEGDMKAGVIFMDVEILDGKLYALTGKILLNAILVYDLSSQQDKKPINPKMLVHLSEVIPPPFIYRDGNIIHSMGCTLRFLAVDASRRELLLVCLYFDTVFARESLGDMNVLKELIDPPEITKFQVFKLEMNDCNNQGYYWVNVENLGDRILFVGNMKSFVVSSVGLNGPKELVKGNSREMDRCEMTIEVIFTFLRFFFEGTIELVEYLCCDDIGEEEEEGNNNNTQWPSFEDIRVIRVSNYEEPLHEHIGQKEEESSDSKLSLLENIIGEEESINSESSLFEDIGEEVEQVSINSEWSFILKTLEKRKKKIITLTTNIALKLMYVN